MSYSLEVEKAYPAAATYRGPADIVTAEFWGPPEEIGLAWLVQNGAEAALSLQGIHPLIMRIWIDESDWYNSKVKLEVVAYSSSMSSNAGIAVAPIIWASVIAAIVGAVALTLISYNIKETDWPQASLPLSLIAIGGLGILALIAVGVFRSKS
jgi:hypothetical protein